MNEKKLPVNAYTFFENESSEFQQKMKVESLLVDIACEFIRYRAEHGMSQKDLARRLEITQAMVSKLESGEYNPTVKMLFEIAQKLSWKFEIRFHELDKIYNYQYEAEPLSEQDSTYLEQMGLAS